MQKMLCTLACSLSLLVASTALANTQMDTTLRLAQTRWYETPGNHFEEDFALVGLRLTRDHLLSESDVMGLSWGYGATLYPSLGYTGKRSILETSGYAFGLGLEAFARGAYDVANAMSLRAELRAEFSMLVGMGTDDNVVPYKDLFAHFLPLLTAAIGVEIPDFKALGADGLILMVRTAMLEVGITTTNSIRNDPVVETWSDMSVEVGVRF